MLWNCERVTAVDRVLDRIENRDDYEYGFIGQIDEDRASVFQNGATLTILSSDEIQVQSNIPVFILAPGYSRMENPRPPGGCVAGSSIPAAEITSRTEVWVR